MLHVLPAGTYGLRPAVNRSNTRTRCGTVCTGGRVHRDAGRIPFQPPSALLPAYPFSSRPSPPLFAGTTSPSDYLHLVPRVPSPRRRCLAGVAPRRIHRLRSFPKPLRPVTAHHRGAEFPKKLARLMFRRSASPRTSTSPSVISVFGPSCRYPHRLSCIAEQYPASFGLLLEKR